MRVFHAKKSKRGKRIRCSSCNKAIKAGEVYRYIFRRYSRRARGVKVIRCTAHPFRPSDLTSSRMGQIYDAVEDANQVIGVASTPDDVADALIEVISCATEVKCEYEDSRNNMPDALQDVGTGAEIEEKVNGLEDWISSLESARDDISGSDLDIEEQGQDEYEEQLDELRDQATAALEELTI